MPVIAGPIGYLISVGNVLEFDLAARDGALRQSAGIAPAFRGGGKWVSTSLYSQTK